MTWDLFKFFSKSLLTKVILLTTLLIIGILGIQTFIYIRLETRTLEDTLIKNKKDFTELLSMNLGAAQEIGGFAFQSQLVEESGKTEDTVYVRFVKPTGEIYLSNIVKERGNFIKDSVIYTKETIIKDDVYEGEKIKVVVSPGSGGYTAWLGFSLKSIQRAVKLMIFSRAILFAGVLIMGIVFAYFLGVSTTRNIKILRDVAEEVGKGNLDAKADIKSKDEVGELALTFNQMTSDLKKSREELEEYSKTLEIKVQSRTKELRELAESLDAQVKERTKELQEKIEELERFNKLAVGRELRMIELKEEIKKLKKEFSKYDSRKQRT